MWGLESKPGSSGRTTRLFDFYSGFLLLPLKFIILAVFVLFSFKSLLLVIDMAVTGSTDNPFLQTILFVSEYPQNMPAQNRTPVSQEDSHRSQCLWAIHYSSSMFCSMENGKQANIQYIHVQPHVIINSNKKAKENEHQFLLIIPQRL